MQRFVAAAEKLHFARAATSVGVSRATLVASVKSLEADLGYPLFDYSAETTTLTDAGVALLARARTDRAEVVARVAPPAGGKAKASKGKGRAPAVKGAPRVGKRRQSR
jgi:hypothetical protein